MTVFISKHTGVHRKRCKHKKKKVSNDIPWGLSRLPGNSSWKIGWRGRKTGGPGWDCWCSACPTNDPASLYSPRAMSSNPEQESSSSSSSSPATRSSGWPNRRSGSGTGSAAHASASWNKPIVIKLVKTDRKSMVATKTSWQCSLINPTNVFGILRSTPRRKCVHFSINVIRWPPNKDLVFVSRIWLPAGYEIHPSLNEPVTPTGWAPIEMWWMQRKRFKRSYLTWQLMFSFGSALWCGVDFKVAESLEKTTLQDKTLHLVDEERRSRSVALRLYSNFFHIKTSFASFRLLSN